MMNNLNEKMGLSMAVVLVASASMPASAATNFVTSGGLVSDGANWNNGLPTGANPGTLSINATANATMLDGYDITHTDGTLTPSGATVLNIGTGSYAVNGSGGGSPEVSGWRGLNVGAGGSFALVDGVADFSTNANTDSTIRGSLTVGGGDFSVARRLLVSNGGDITITGGTVTTANITTAASIGGTSGGSTGNYFLNGGDIDFRFMQFGNAGVDFSFGGTTSGNITVENFGGFRHNPAYIDLDFAPGSRMSLTLTSPVGYDDPAGDDRFGWANDNLGPAWAEALWSDGRLTAESGTINFNSVSWSDASNSSVGLGNGEYFSFDGNTLVLAAIPEPAASSLIGVALGMLMLRRRRSKL